MRHPLRDSRGFVALIQYPQNSILFDVLFNFIYQLRCPKYAKMSSTSQSHRVVVNQSSTAVYTRLANDSSASIEESTQISRPQNGNPDNGKYGLVRENTLCQDEEDEEDEEDEDEDDDEEEERRQDGVRQAEAITSVWTFRALVFTYFLYVNFSRWPRGVSNGVIC